MVLVVHIDKHFPADEEASHFVSNLLQQWIKQHAADQIHLLIHKDSLFKKPAASQNLSIAAYQLNHLFYHLRLRRKLQVFIKKMGADVLISFDKPLTGVKNFSQCLIQLKDEGKKKAKPEKLNTATSIVVLSNGNRDILGRHSILADKLQVVYGAPDDITYFVTEEEKLAIKEKFTEGAEFFLYKGGLANEKALTTLLKAFSLFKKRQKSSMKLVINETLEGIRDVEKLLSTYKYREDVVTTPGLKGEAATLLSSAYAFLYLPLQANRLLPAMNAMKRGVPVITSEYCTLKEIAETAALYTNPENVDDIADKMMCIYKDEQLRSRLLNDAKSIVERYTWEGAVKTIRGRIGNRTK